MNNKEFIAALAARTGYTQDESQKMVKTVVDMMGKSFETGDPVPVIGFGTFEVKSVWNVLWLILQQVCVCWFLQSWFLTSNLQQQSKDM